MGFVADVFSVLMIDPVTNDVIGSTTLQDANIDVEVQENDITGGAGAPIIGVLHSNRQINIALTDVTWKPEYLARQLGQDIVIGKNRAFASSKWYTASGTTGVKITLDGEPPLATNNKMSIYKADGTKVSTFTVSGNDVTFPSGVTANEKVEVRTYIYETSTTAQTIKIDSTSFPSSLQVVLETLEVDGEERPLAKLQYQFDRCLPSGTFSVNTTQDRTAGTQEMNLRVLKPADTTELGRLIRIPLS